MPAHDFLLGGGEGGQTKIKDLKKKIAKGTLSDAELAILFPAESAADLVEPTVIPIADDEQVRRARRRSLARRRGRGRASTIFSRGEGLGG